MALISALVIAAAALLRPAAARCPDGSDLRTGIRRDGGFECWPSPVGDPEWDGTWGRPDRSVQPSGRLAGRIYCSGRRVPVVIDERSVACR